MADDALKNRLKEEILDYKVLAKNPDIGLARCLEVGEVLRVLLYIRDGVRYDHVLERIGVDLRERRKNLDDYRPK